MHIYWEWVDAFYPTPYIEASFEPRHKFNLPSAVTALLAGELEGGWKILWRMRLFFWIIKIHSRWPILPRISFEEPTCKGQEAASENESADAANQRLTRIPLAERD